MEPLRNELQSLEKRKSQETFRPRVIAADNEEIVRELLVARLSAAGFQVEVVKGGIELFRTLLAKGAGYYNAIISDNSMSDSVGIEVIERIRTIPSFNRTPIVLFTGDLDTNGTLAQRIKSAHAVLVPKTEISSLAPKLEELIKESKQS